MHLEKRLGGIIPDIIIESKGKKLLVEIVVSHRVDENKIKKIAAGNFATVVFYAKYLVEDLYLKKDFRLTNKSFQKEITDGTKYKFWLFNPKLEKIKSRLRDKFAVKKLIKSFEGGYDFFHYVENCPLQIKTWRGGRNVGKSYAKTSDCYKCRFNVQNEYEHFMNDINCIGHLENDLNRIKKQMKWKFLFNNASR